MIGRGLAGWPDAIQAALAVYLVADPAQSRSGDLIADTVFAIAGGVTMVQLRAKNLSDREALALAIPLAAACRERQVPFLVNDRLDVALAVDADGLHVGMDDLPIDVVRRLGGADFLIGWSPDTDARVAAAGTLGADYIGLGPVFPTGSKPDAGPALGLDGLGRQVGLSTLPTVAIGGITEANAADVIATGTDGVAVISAILRTTGPGAASARLRQVVETAGTARRGRIDVGL